jgi:hypothetical protein
MGSRRAGQLPTRTPRQPTQCLSQRTRRPRLSPPAGTLLLYVRLPARARTRSPSGPARLRPGPPHSHFQAPCQRARIGGPAGPTAGAAGPLRPQCRDGVRCGHRPGPRPHPVPQHLRRPPPAGGTQEGAAGRPGDGAYARAPHARGPRRAPTRRPAPPGPCMYLIIRVCCLKRHPLGCLPCEASSCLLRSCPPARHPPVPAPSPKLVARHADSDAQNRSLPPQGPVRRPSSRGQHALTARAVAAPPACAAAVPAAHFFGSPRLL